MSLFLKSFPQDRLKYQETLDLVIQHWKGPHCRSKAASELNCWTSLCSYICPKLSIKARNNITSTHWIADSLAPVSPKICKSSQQFFKKRMICCTIIIGVIWELGLSWYYVFRTFSTNLILFCKIWQLGTAYMLIQDKIRKKDTHECVH